MLEADLNPDSPKLNSNIVKSNPKNLNAELEIEHKMSSRISQSKRATTIVQSAKTQCT